MTLCVSWIRKENDVEELVFATDSCLSAGERWHSGVKLFDLPRKDCLICFAGDTLRTYPLILNLITSIKFDEHLLSRNTDIKEVLEYLCGLFTNLCKSISDYGTQDFNDVLGDFEFMFGGWSWKDNSFKIWKLKYKSEVDAFMHDEVDRNSMTYCFIGDKVDKSEDKLEEEISKSGKVLAREFDMEPLKVLLSMIRDKTYSSIDGAIQIAKIYPPGATEFFGVLWPSIDGKKTFLGKDVNFENNPAVKFIDPDTATIIDEELPEKLISIEELEFGVNTEFVKKLYPEGKLKDGINKRDNHILKSILSDVAYSQFLENQNITIEEGVEVEEEVLEKVEHKK